MKNKKLILTLMIILIVLILAAVGAVATLYFTTDMFKTNDELFAKYLFEENNMATILSSEKIGTQREMKQANSYSSEGTLTVGLESQGQAVELAQLHTNSQYNNETKRSYTEATLKKDQEELLKFSYINSDDIYGIKCDSIYEHYIGIRNKDLKEFARKMGVPEEQVSQIPDSISAVPTVDIKTLITDEDCKYLTDTYLPILNNSISKEKYSKREEMIVVGGKNYNANAYTLTLNEDDIRQIVTNIITKAKTDNETIRILESMMAALNSEEQVNVEEMLQNILEEVDKASQTPMNLEITVYEVNGKKVRTHINANNEINLTFDIVANTEEYQKVNMVIDGIMLNGEETRMEISLQKNVMGEKGAAMPEEVANILEMTIKNSEGAYNINANMTVGYQTKTIDFTIKDENQNTLQMSYDEKIQITNDAPAEIEELKGSNTVIVNDYPREQLEPFIYSIMQKAVEVFGTVFQKLSVI